MILGKDSCAQELKSATVVVRIEAVLEWGVFAIWGTSRRTQAQRVCRP